MRFNPASMMEKTMAHFPQRSDATRWNVPFNFAAMRELRLVPSHGRLLSFPDQFPPIPSLLTTQLQLELLLSEQVIDLRGVSNVILNDPGATLQVLRLFGAEFGADYGPQASGAGPILPIRMEDCLAGLEAQAWFDAVCAATLEASPALPEICAAWSHACDIAQCAKHMAEHMHGYCPEEACLVGLLHELEDLPALLGWDRHLFSVPRSAAEMAAAWKLPRHLLLCSEAPEESDTHWRTLMAEAHRRLTQTRRVA